MVLLIAFSLVSSTFEDRLIYRIQPWGVSID